MNTNLNVSDFKLNKIVSKSFFYYSNVETNQEETYCYNKDQSILTDSTSEFFKSVWITGDKIITNINNDISSAQKSNNMILSNQSYSSSKIS